MEKKKVISLYRVSTKKQVDLIVQNSDATNKFDIPMQKQACRDFIVSKPDWESYRELSEFGVSGYKVSAKERDAIQEIQHEALEKKFDVLLVFMFDRLGRIDDETPFVVEWFVKQGIEVWSVKEGEQRFENHVDKLTNYIRFWQASGESEKTSIRTKERLSQIVQEGRFRGGSAAYGYKLVKKGRVNKRGHEVYELEIDEIESAVVRMIFDLYLTKGYGPQRISSYLTDQGILTRKGDNFTNSSVRNMVRNRSYTGVLKSGETETDIFPDLQIIAPEIFKAAEELMKQRSIANNEDRRIPLNTKGNSLLSGNVFCGHCGSRLILTTNGRKHVRKDGGVSNYARIRYVCYNKSRHKQRCDGQTGYTAGKLDRLIETIVHKLFSTLNDPPKESLIEERYSERISEYQIALAQADATLQVHQAEAAEYEAEVIKVIRGESKLSAELLNKMYDEAKEKAEESKQQVRALEDNLKNGELMRDTLSKQFESIKSWSDMYDSCDMESKKMILSRLFSSVRVRRGYDIEINLPATCEQLGLVLEEAGVTLI